MKVLVTYFSCSNCTKRVAQKIAEKIKGDLFEITPEVAYSTADLNWHDKNSRSSVEMKDLSSRPAIKNKVENMNEYDVVFVGFPIWWYIAPTIINTFLESYSFDGKIIIPFATSGGSGVGETDKCLMKSLSENAHLCPTTMLNGSVTEDRLTQWFSRLDL